MITTFKILLIMLAFVSFGIAWTEEEKDTKRDMALLCCFSILVLFASLKWL